MVSGENKIEVGKRVSLPRCLPRYKNRHLTCFLLLIKRAHILIHNRERGKTPPSNIQERRRQDSYISLSGHRGDEKG